ncbi:MAG: division/cell wall cluster transcriptional repressor MraZ, partial [Acutalibacteraceae bacterium]|nr:division/cell wall cluster transcriptional repressor MraZ [Acutalibacteraceae bacterium]
YRFLSNSAVFAELDASGRVLLPVELRAFAGIETEAHIVGMRSNIEIWSPENWQGEQENFTVQSFAPIIDELGFSFGE